MREAPSIPHHVGASIRLWVAHASRSRGERRTSFSSTAEFESDAQTFGAVEEKAAPRGGIRIRARPLEGRVGLEPTTPGLSIKAR